MSGGVAFVGAHQHRGQRVAAARPAHLFEDRAVAGDAADRGQRLEMLGPGVRRRQQQEDEVDRATVDRLVVDRLGEPREQTVDLAEAVDLAVRDCDALSKAGLAELISLGNARQHRRRIGAEALRGEIRQLLEQRALVTARDAGLDRVEIEKF
jgi:hypothetical protein